jgi:curved DNA-binding protein
MTDYYQTLGVSENASPEEIKRAYRTLANKHHPDKGGDQAKFKDISVANDILGDPQKRAEYDQQRQFGGGPQVRFHTGGFDFGDVFSQHFQNAGHPFSGPFGNMFGDMGRGMRKNRDLNIQCHVSFIDSFNGKQLEANYQLPSGRNQNVVINVPAGIRHGDTIRYGGLGDDSFQGVPRGNLNVTVLVQPDPVYRRQDDDVYMNVYISPIEAMIGTRKTIKTLTGQTMDLDIRPGVESGVEYASNGHGFVNPNIGNRGRFVSVINIRSTSVTDPVIVERLKQLNDEIAQRG